MKIDVRGRVRNVTLAVSKPLLPLYEAIVNSIQAIEDAAPANGRITIEIARDRAHLLQDQTPEAGEITGFVVTDNGIGFNDANYAAFETADTTYKADRGGKGIGRFLWLVAFDGVEVTSHFKAGESLRCRRFAFSIEGEGVNNMTIGESTEITPRTSIRLSGFRERFRRQCPKKPETIAAHLIEYCLQYFIRSDCPRIAVIDEAVGYEANLNELFQENMASLSQRDQFTINGHEFRLLHVRLSRRHAAEHLVHFCANSRVVKSEDLAGHVPNLVKHLQDENGDGFIYAAYVDSEVLDGSVNSERTAFLISADDSELLSEDITWKDILAGVFEKCREYLSPYTEPIRLKKRERIERFVASEGPMYRPILKYIEDKMDLIDPEISDEGLDMSLYEAYHAVQVELKAQGEALVQRDAQDEEWEEFQRQLAEYFAKVSDINKSDLARYVCHRRAVLDFLQRQLSVKSNGKYRREDRVHQVVFPMRRTSNDVLFQDHNLWLLDEKLVYHAFLASDKPLGSMPGTEIDSAKEPDIIVFDKACAFGTGDPPYSAITIVEFKRPMRTDYSGVDNPFVQVRGYITAIREGKARTASGRDVPLASPEVPFYCYIVCDPSQKLSELAYDFELEKTPDNEGFFGYKRQYKAYFEVVSYTKMLIEAKRRNVAFFDKLGLQTRLGK